MRTKVAALLLSLAAVWAFAAWVTLREGANLLWAATLDGAVVASGDPLLVELQRERRLSLTHLGDGGSAGEQALRAQRGRTDAAATAFVGRAGSPSVAFAASDALDLRLEQVFARLEGLQEARAALDTGHLDRARAFGAYTGVIDTLHRAYDALATLDDQQTARDAGTLVELRRAVELIAQEDAFAAGALAAGGLSVVERGQFAQLVGAQRFARAEAAAVLPDADRRGYDLVAATAFTRLGRLEDQLIQGSAPVGSGNWRSSIEPVLAGLDANVRQARAGLVERATPVARAVIVRLALVGGVGLVAVIASIVLSVSTARAVRAQLTKPREAAHEQPERRLPGVERIGRSEEADPAVEAPPLTFGDDQSGQLSAIGQIGEIGDVGEIGRAVTTVQESTVTMAVEQAELRRGIGEILLNLARRTQGLVHRQLTVLDEMERREHKPEELRDLFRLDHLATRMRRNAENLIVLSGSSPGRTWLRSVPMLDVVRGALAEVEDFTRVQLRPMGEVTLAGKAVGDVVHLLAELIENAVSFSPPYATVQVRGQMVVSGYEIEIEDRGLGMTREDLEAANRRIAEPSAFGLSGTARLGLYVVARLAERHDVRVRLRASPYGGVTVVVLVPLQLIGLEPGPEDAGLENSGQGDDLGFAVLEDFGRKEREDAPLPGIPAPRSAPNGPLAGRVTAPRPVQTAGQPIARAPRPLLPARRAPDPTPPEPALERAASPPEDHTPVVSDPARLEAARVACPLEDPAVAEPVPAAPEPARVLSVGSLEGVAPEVPEPAFTPSGLPFRVPQANLAPGLTAEQAASPHEHEQDERSPEEIRAIMGSFQSGTRLGRTQAAKLTEGEA
ncbi:nitrate- and nitrite sensing domain-containing protein [Nonomuraea sp. NPDC059194]|uniref:sensor histidine kinase n=1 Tax=Nonomuraea sp. NPDC059194 TaxID=3346764 RepID=UPI0036C8ECDB